MEYKIQISLTNEQARLISEALELYARLGIGQLETILERIQIGHIPPRTGPVSNPTIDEIKKLIVSAKYHLGLAANGCLSIGNDVVTSDTKRAWEIMKEINKALAYLRDPDPEFKTVDYDGAIVRHTDDPLPTLTVVTK